MTSTKIEVTIDLLLRRVEIYNSNKEDLDLIKKAYDYASQKHFGEVRKSGESYIEHPLNVAYILTDLKLDAKALSAALLHDVLEETNTSREELQENFDDEICNLVDSVTKIKKINFSSETEQIAANQRKILVGLSNDVRVLIIKLAERLHNMRTLYVLPVEKQKKTAKETLEILTPVAHRLGIYKLKSELEDLSLRYLKPDAFYDIVEKLNTKKTERDEAVNKMVNEVSALLTEHNIKHEIKGRSKSIYSIYSKLSKGKSFNDIYDLLGIRVLVDTEQQCYLTLGLIHSKYKPVPKRFKDYIAMPKTNLYQSLHTTIFGVDGELFEIQIRTPEMNLIAEYGIASHWSYKEHGSKETIQDKIDQKLQIFRNIIEINNIADSSEEFISDVRHDLLSEDNIFAYTPKGDVIELPPDATPVDFAYKVHSEVGEKMVGAIVNDNIVPLDYKLNTGDIVKINTNKASKGPNRDWLNFVITAQARSHIKSFHSKLDKENYIEKGIDILEKEMRKNNYIMNEVINPKNIDIILDYFKYKNIDELYSSIGSNKINPSSIFKLLFKEEIVEPVKLTSIPNIVMKNDILVEGISEIKVNIGSCCKPVPEDNIIGYITKGHGITIHRSTCKNITDIDERLINVKWNENINKKYETDLIIYSNKSDILLDVITKASPHKITINSVNSLNNSEYKVYVISVMVENSSVLEKFITDLSSISYIKKVERIIN